MRALRVWLTRLRHALLPLLPSDRDEITDEIESHLQLHIDDNIRAGMTPADARRAALLKFGPLEAIKDDCRARASIRVIDALRQDVAYGCRTLNRARTYACAAILSLALGIGGTTAIFAILDSLLLKPLPVRDANQLVALVAAETGQDALMNYHVWQAIRTRQLLDAPCAWATDLLSVRQGNETSGIDAVWANGTFFAALGMHAIVGRTFEPRDDVGGGGPDGAVVVISHAFWLRRFGGDPAAVGRTLTIDGVPFRIIGVTPPEFFGLEVGRSVDVMLPLETERLLRRIPSRFDSPNWPWLHVMARLRPGETLAGLSAMLRAAQPEIRAATMPAYQKPELREAYLRQAWSMRSAANGSSSLRARYSSALFTLLVIVTLVLLMACVNVANLQLARTIARRSEFSLRSALGASRARILQQHLVESLMLSTCGAVAGYFFSRWAAAVIVGQLSTWASTPFLDLSPDLRVLTATAALTVLTAVLFGTFPAFRAARSDPMHALKGRGTAWGRGRAFGRSALIAQAALSFVLLVGAGLFVRSFAALAHRDLGFDRSRVLVAVLDSRRAVVSAGERLALYERVRDAVASVPGVEAAAFSTATPLGNAGVRFTIDVAGSTMASAAHNVLVNPVSPEWFQTYGTRLMRGRDFTARDTGRAADVVIVNEAFQRRYFPTVDPIDQEIVLTDGESPGRPARIVGVVQDAAFTSVREPIPPTMYRPFTQGAEKLDLLPDVSFSIRAAGEVPPDRLGGAVAAAIARIDGRLSVSFRTVTTYLSAYYVRERALAGISLFFAVCALLLAFAGIYGVTAYSVIQRRAEIAVRIALGATRKGIAALVLRDVGWLAGIGLLAGVLLSMWAARFVRALLFGLDPHDPSTFGLAVLAIATVFALAAWLPALWAARTNPSSVLREG